MVHSIGSGNPPSGGRPGNKNVWERGGLSGTFKGMVEGRLKTGNELRVVSMNTREVEAFQKLLALESTGISDSDLSWHAERMGTEIDRGRAVGAPGSAPG